MYVCMYVCMYIFVNLCVLTHALSLFRHGRTHPSRVMGEALPVNGASAVRGAGAGGRWRRAAA